MAFEGLSDKLSAAFKRLRSKGKLTEADVREAMREVRLALLEADVNYKVAKDFTKTVTERSIGAQVMESLTPAQQVIKIVNEEMTALMGGTASLIKSAQKPPTVIMLCGLQGAGKTTHAGKLAVQMKRQGHRPLLVACDIYRPAAIEQLRVVSNQAGAAFFENGTRPPVETAKKALNLARDNGYDMVILDTAGRLHIDDTLMNELKNVKKNVNPNEILLVVDAMTGQDAVNAAKSFDEALDITGVILTKLDGDTRGGAALSIRAVTGKPIKFCGVGEKLDNLEVFHPERMASRILGMGDMLSLIEEATVKMDQKKAEETARRLQQNKFDMTDLLAQFQQVKQMGSMKSLLSKIPGMEKQLRDADIDDRIVDRMEAIILSMTPQERAKPDLLNASRKRRIAAGSGMRVEDVNRLLKQYEQMQKMMKQMKNNKRFRGGGMGGFGGLKGLGL